MQEMTSLERTISFIKGEPVDRVPFHPLVMQFAARYAGVPYRDYCLDYEKKCYANLKTAEDFNIDWVHVGGHPYTEAEDYGLVVEYPENSLPLAKTHLITGPQDFAKIRPLDIENCHGMMGRVEGVRHCVERAGDYMAICGWAEGPMAEYTDLRGMTDGCMDMLIHPDEVKEMLAIIVENAKKWITLQAQAGAPLIGIGDAACSQIGPKLYREFIFDHHKALVEHIHSLGAYADFHICGDTSAILPMLIETGANMIDVDHLVGDVAPFVDMLGPEQVIRGTCDPVLVVEEGTPEIISDAVCETHRLAQGKCMVAAGCEIPLDTPIENLKAMSRAAATLTISSVKREHSPGVSAAIHVSQEREQEKEKEKEKKKKKEFAPAHVTSPINAREAELTEEEKDDLFDAICDGDRETVIELVTKALVSGEDLDALLKTAMIPAMTEVGDMFSEGKIYVPEMLVSARAMQGGIDIIDPIIAETGHEPIGRVCIGSVKGDIHDIGKNLVVMMLRGAGFEVEDLGVDVSIADFEAAVRGGNQVVCLSALLTTTRPEMQKVVKHFRNSSFDPRIVIGGAIVTQEYADAIGADGFGEDAPGAVSAVKRVLALSN